MPKTSARFKTELLRSDGSHEWIYIRVPVEIVESFSFTGNTRRVVCTINKAESFQCAVMPNGKGDFYITVNKEHRVRLGVAEGDTVAIELEKDTSKYGLPMPEEFREVLDQDREGDRLFHALTPGKQRTLLHQINSAKDIDRRIHIALVIVQHLKDNEGRLDYALLFEQMRRPTF